MHKNAEDNQPHHIYYASWKISKVEKRYSNCELEVLAIVKAQWKFWVYLLGISFRIVTDYRAFVQTMSKKDSCLRVAH